MNKLKIKISKYDVIVLCIGLYLLLSRIGVDAFGFKEHGSDVAFLFNRVDQLRQIILDGNLLKGFFYNDFQGVGYGSSFFYGYLTLLPFTIIKSYDVFCKVYFTFSITFKENIKLLHFYFGRNFVYSFFDYVYLFSADGSSCGDYLPIDI